MFDLLAGLVVGDSVASKVTKTTKKVQREVLGDDELSDVVGDIAHV